MKQMHACKENISSLASCEYFVKTFAGRSIKTSACDRHALVTARPNFATSQSSIYGTSYDLHNRYKHRLTTSRKLQ